MFRPARWRTDRTKIKAAFKLQFHATQISHLGGDGLMISVVPGDTGKPTVRLEKAVIRDGCCKWDSPVFESVKLTRDPKTGKIQERMYHFILSTGSGKSCTVGEVSLDFADYAETTKASSVSLPIKSSNTKATLNVLIQRLQDSVAQGDVEENEDAKAKVQDRSLRSQFSNSDKEESVDGNSTEDVLVPPLNQTIRTLVANGNFSASSGSDLTTSSECSSGLNTPRENTARSTNIIQRDPNGVLSSLSSVTLPDEPISEGAIVVYGETPKSQWEWSHGSGQDSEVLEEAGSVSELDRMRSQLSSLARQLNLSELELQTLRKQIVKESKRSHELSKEVLTLKEERDSLGEENEKLRAINERFHSTKERKSKLQFEGGDLHELVDELRQELNYEKNLNSDLRLQLQKTRESNAELILAVRELEEMLNHKDEETFDPAEKLGISDEEDEEQKALEAIVRGHKDAKGTYLLEQKILDLNSEVEIYRRDRDELEIQMEQLALDYEILKQKHHEVVYKLEQSQLQEQLKLQYECCGLGSESEYECKIERLEGELQTRSAQHTDALDAIAELDSKIKILESELLTRSGELSASMATIGELEGKIRKLETELRRRSDELSDSLSTTTELESKVDRLESQLQLRSDELSDSLTNISKLERKVERSESELKKRLEEFSDSLATISELESNTERLETELKNKSEQFSDSLATISDLEGQVNNLEEELERRGEEFENDLGVVTRAKVEQEKRAISAEEALQKMKRKNSDTADRLQEEFRKLSLQMASTFQSNERVAIKAVREAAELRKANEKLQLMGNGFAKAGELSREFQEKAKQLEAEIARLSTENNTLSTRVGEAQLAVDKGNAERSKLLSSMALLQLELEEKDQKVRDMELELGTLKSQCDELKDSLLKDDVEKENLRKEVLEVKEELKKKEIASSDTEVTDLREKIQSLECQIKQKESAIEGLEKSISEKEQDFTTKIDELESRLEELNLHNADLGKNPSQKASDCSEKFTSENVRPHEIADNRQGELEDLSIELALLKETNESMEIELKEMQEKYSAISLRFAEVEGERQKLVMTVRYLRNARKK